MPVKISQNENHPLSQRLHKLNIHANIFILYVLPFLRFGFGTSEHVAKTDQNEGERRGKRKIDA